MNPARTFEDISYAILNNMKDDITATIGILVANGMQSSAKDLVLDHMNTFDNKSGDYIDFYLPGYYHNIKDGISETCLHDNAIYHPEDNMMEVFRLKRDGKQQKYYFDEGLFSVFLSKMELDMNIKYTYSPMLILVEVSKDNCRGDLRYQKRVVIELGNDAKRSSLLIDALCEAAKKEIGLKSLRNNLYSYYFKATVMDNVIKFLQGDWIEALSNTYNDIQKFRIKEIV